MHCALHNIGNVVMKDAAKRLEWKVHSKVESVKIQN